MLGPLLTTVHRYPWGTIELVALWAERVAGEPAAHDHAALRWAAPAELARYDFAAADLAIVRALEQDAAD